MKCKIKSQFTILEYLQGNQTRNSKIQLWIESHTLKTKVRISENQEKHNADKLCANWKIIDDLRMQLRQSQRKEKENAAAAERAIRELSRQLREQLWQVQMMKEQLLIIPSVRPQDEHMVATEMDEKLQAVKAALLRIQDAHRVKKSVPCSRESDSNRTQSLSELDRHQSSETPVSEIIPGGLQFSNKGGARRIGPCGCFLVIAKSIAITLGL
ncbi:uncharacterized protein LOC133413949 [Phycodurus eques]|uniref:uncharacterized protein LOC133413949 n=1 Tax=Phycodurus eques TaxID=693459 RepID=UPI002ACE8AF5|nr:uncharacterized protein LOC133413949 [Phycodurus eques]